MMWLLLCSLQQKRYHHQDQQDKLVNKNGE
jgi:hypothetical protein